MTFVAEDQSMYILLENVAKRYDDLVNGITSVVQIAYTQSSSPSVQQFKSSTLRRRKIWTDTRDST